MNDPKEIWQHQPAEPLHMSTELLERRYKRFENRRRAGLYALWGLAGLATAASIYVLRPVSILWMAWSAWMLYQSYARRRPVEPAGELTLSFYRAELVRRQHYFSSAWMWFLLPTLLCVVVSIAAALDFVPKSLPFLTLLLIWFLILPFQFRREQRSLQLEIDTLDALIN